MYETNRYVVQITEPIGKGSTSTCVQGPFDDYQTAVDFGKEQVVDDQCEFIVHKLVPVCDARNAFYIKAKQKRKVSNEHMTLSDAILWVENLPDRERDAIKRYFIRRDEIPSIIENVLDDVVKVDKPKPDRFNFTQLNTTGGNHV